MAVERLQNKDRKSAGEAKGRREFRRVLFRSTAVLRRRRAEPLRQRLPQRRGRASARGARDRGRRGRHAGHPAGDGRRRHVTSRTSPIATLPEAWRWSASRTKIGRAPGRRRGDGSSGVCSSDLQLFSADGELDRYVNVYLNDEDVRVLAGLETAVGEGDTLVILPAMAGGAT